MYPTRYIDPTAVGYLVAEHIRCGKPNCRCRGGQRHGPYWYVMYRRFEGRRWRQRKKYVPRDKVSAVRSALETNKARDRSAMVLLGRSRKLRGAVARRRLGGIANDELVRICRDLQD